MERWIWFLPVVIVAWLLLRSRRRGVSAEEARKLLEEGAAVLDVRTRDEYKTGHVKGSVNIPLNEIPAGIEERFPERDQVLLVHCQSGVRSRRAVLQLRQAGYTNAHDLGGLANARKLTS